MTEEVTAIVTGVGGGVGQSIIKGLSLSMERDGEVAYTIVGVDADPQAAGLYRADEGYVVPMATEDGYVDRLVEIAEAVDADVLVPGSDPEVLEIAEAAPRLERETGVEVLASPPESVEIGLDKWKTYQFLDDNGFATPFTRLADDATEVVSEVGFPIVVKPRTGSASRGMYVVMDRAELEFALERSTDEVIVQEYLVPDAWGDDLSKSDLERQIDEYSTEVIVDANGDVVNSLANWRKMDKGVPSVARVRPYDEVREVCEAVAAELDVLGPVNLQSRVTEDGVTFFEVNTRFTGSTAVRCVAGFNGPHTMVCNLVLGETITAEDLAFENLVEMRYKDEVYVSEDVYAEALETGSVSGRGRTYEYF